MEGCSLDEPVDPGLEPVDEPVEPAVDDGGAVEESASVVVPSVGEVDELAGSEGSDDGSEDGSEEDSGGEAEEGSDEGSEEDSGGEDDDGSSEVNGSKTVDLDDRLTSDDAGDAVRGAVALEADPASSCRLRFRLVAVESKAPASRFRRSTGWSEMATADARSDDTSRAASRVIV